MPSPFKPRIVATRAIDYPVSHFHSEPTAALSFSNTKTASIPRIVQLLLLYGLNRSLPVQLEWFDYLATIIIQASSQVDKLVANELPESELKLVDYQLAGLWIRMDIILLPKQGTVHCRY